MSGHRFIPGEMFPGRCARCGCAETEAVHPSAIPPLTAEQLEAEAAMLTSMAVSVRHGYISASRDQHGRIQFTLTEGGRQLVEGLGKRDRA